MLDKQIGGAFASAYESVKDISLFSFNTQALKHLDESHLDVPGCHLNDQRLADLVSDYLKQAKVADDSRVVHVRVDNLLEHVLIE